MRRRLVLAMLLLLLAGCGRRGRLRLPEREGEAEPRRPAPTAPARSAPSRPAPASSGLETV